MAEKKTRWEFKGLTFTGKPFFRRVRETSPIQPPSIDEFPPPGVEGPLTKEPPVLAKDPKDRKEKRQFVTFIEQSQPKGDKD